MAVPLALNVTVTSSVVALERVAVKVKAEPSSDTLDAELESVTVGALSLSVIVKVTD